VFVISEDVSKGGTADVVSELSLLSSFHRNSIR